MTTFFFQLFILPVAITYAVPLLHQVGDPHYERVITDLHGVCFGVPIDYRYNESRKGEGCAASVPGCPKSEFGYPWVYHKDPKVNDSSPYKCYLAKQKGPCELGQSLFVEKGNPFGFCNWDCFEDVELRLSESNQVRLCLMPPALGGKEVVFFPESRKCYELFDQGPCKKNEWLVKTNKTGDDGGVVGCQDQPGAGGHVPYNDGDWNYPPCQCQLLFSTISVNLVDKNCPKDMKFSQLLQKCLKTFTFAQ